MKYGTIILALKSALKRRGQSRVGEAVFKGSGVSEIDGQTNTRKNIFFKMLTCHWGGSLSVFV